MPKKTYAFGRYLKLFGTDAVVSDSETGVGVINLYRRAVNKKEIILEFLNRKYGDEFQFKPDFFAGLSRIEFIRRAEKPKKPLTKPKKTAAKPAKPKAKKTAAAGIALTATQKKRLAATGRVTVKRGGKFVTITR